LKPQPNVDDPKVVGGTSIQMCEAAAVWYLSYKLIDFNKDWK
jgi:hypothetical protein